MKKLEHGLELFVFASRWIQAPMFVGLGHNEDKPEWLDTTTAATSRCALKLTGGVGLKKVTPDCNLARSRAQSVSKLVLANAPEFFYSSIAKG